MKLHNSQVMLCIICIWQHMMSIRILAFYTVTDIQEAKKGGFDIYYHGDDENVNSFIRECGDGNEVDNWYSQNAVTRVKRAWGEKAFCLIRQRISQRHFLTCMVCLP